jgi:hypothetical protein
MLLSAKSQQGEEEEIDDCRAGDEFADAHRKVEHGLSPGIEGKVDPP